MEKILRMISKEEYDSDYIVNTVGWYLFVGLIWPIQIFIWCVGIIVFVINKLINKLIK